MPREYLTSMEVHFVADRWPCVEVVRRSTRDYRVHGLGRDVARSRRARPDYGALIMRRFGPIDLDQNAG